MKVKRLTMEDGERLKISRFRCLCLDDTYSEDGLETVEAGPTLKEIEEMYTKDTPLVHCGNYVYSVTQDIYDQAESVRRASQKAQILKVLKAGDTITALEALQRFGCLRLSARIGELKKDGYGIDNPLVDIGNGKRVTRYKLRSLPQGDQFRQLQEMIYFPKEGE